MATENRWLDWARELQFLSQCALAYCKDPYDTERFKRIREISAEMAAAVADEPVGKVKALFCGDEGYQTPKLDTRAAVIRDGEILLVQEKDGRWALPGGWMDYDQTIRGNAAKETLEEAGMRVRPLRLVALLEHNRHNLPPCVHSVFSAFVLCEYLDGAYRPTLETVDSRFFPRDALPSPLAENKSNAAQIEMCFHAAADPNWQTEFD